VTTASNISHDSTIGRSNRLDHSDRTDHSDRAADGDQTWVVVVATAGWLVMASVVALLATGLWTPGR
jgi:hypothetical protein